MINREMRKVSLVSFTSGTDAYGQKRQLGSNSKEIEMMIKPYRQSNIDDVRYVDVTDIGLTYEKSIMDSNQIIDGEKTFQIMYVIPSNRLYQIMMKQV